MKYRDATLEDMRKIVEIYNTTVAGRMVTADTEPVSVESRLPWFHHHSEVRPLWMIEENGAVLGWVSFQNFYGRPAYRATAEISIYLDPSARGKGVGAKVLDHCLTQCPKLGIKTLLGYVFAHNEPSVKLFSYAGFRQWAMLPDIAELDGIERSVVIFGKRI